MIYVYLAVVPTIIIIAIILYFKELKAERKRIKDIRKRLRKKKSEDK